MRWRQSLNYYTDITDSRSLGHRRALRAQGLQGHDKASRSDRPPGRLGRRTRSRGRYSAVDVRSLRSARPKWQASSAEWVARKAWPLPHNGSRISGEPLLKSFGESTTAGASRHELPYPEREGSRAAKPLDTTVACYATSLPWHMDCTTESFH